MSHLYHLLAEETQKWSDDGYRCEEYPAISEILNWLADVENENLRYLRKPQLKALEVYWYLRLIKGTPNIFTLYQDLYKSTADLHESLGVSEQAFRAVDYDKERIWDEIANNDEFVRNFHLEALRESLNLDYPSVSLLN